MKNNSVLHISAFVAVLIVIVAMTTEAAYIDYLDENQDGLLLEKKEVKDFYSSDQVCI